jgi:hypothetical protein
MRGFTQWRAGALVAAAALFLVALGYDAAPSAAKPGKTIPPIHVSGVVYTFDNQVPIVGATVRVAEVPGASATSGPGGRYDMVVPDGTRFTPYADAAGHHRIYLQSFVSQGHDINRVNFQIPTEGTYDLLGDLLSVPRDANNELVDCGVVSTFSTADVRNMTHDEFVAYGAHGVAGATASATPALPKPVYFNAAVLPDVNRTESSEDGGVIWPVVKPGVYRFEASHPTRRFASFQATCAPGRVVNANPTRGFFELLPGEELDRTVRAKLAKTRFDLSGRKPLLRVRVQAGEYTAVTVGLLTGKKMRAKRSTRGYAPGKRSVKVLLPGALSDRRVVAQISIEDGEGNVKTVRRRLQAPAL